jgi:hypothetical protein
MKKTESELTAHEQLNQIRRRRQRLAERVARLTGRPTRWYGGKLYYLDGQKELVRRSPGFRDLPNLPKPGREAIGWKRQLPKQAKKTIARETKREMQAVAIAPQVIPPTPQPAPEPAVEQPLKLSVGELIDRRLAALRELAAKGISAK